jgi:hypothetical protein
MRNFLFALFMGLFLIPTLCFSKKWPDLGGIVDFSKPQKISNRLFILTNPKSGSHLLLYSIMKITRRPLRGRVSIWHFKHDPPFFPPDNMMGYPLDFSKPTIYWGHEYHLLKQLNRGKNQLIFILRNYKENISSRLMIKYKKQREKEDFNLGNLLLDEVLHEKMIFKEYMLRLQLFDDWDPSCRHLVFFEELIHHPEIFIPQVMAFIGDESDYCHFISHYEEFKSELMEKYREKGNATGSGSETHFFSQKIPPEILQIVDDYVCHQYPDLWNKYLKRFTE